jgi:Zn-dependent peptidase ImmA (M78 family)/transcriptional regulator with XRE-family HTH domain
MALWERLRYAREKANLTLRAVAEATEIGESSLSEFERGLREPRLSQVQTLATLYRRSLAFLLSDAPLPKETVLWREQPTPQVAAKLGGTFIRLCEQYHNLETWLDERVPNILPTEAGDPDSLDFVATEGLAHRLHGELGLGDHPGQSLLVVLEELCGVKVFHLPFEPTGSAACTRSEAFGPAILLNSLSVRWRRNFDLAHELFHLITWNVFRRSANGDQPLAQDREEKLANAFASKLLIPADAARNAINERIRDDKISFADISDIARQFDVSVEALCWRMFSLRYFKREQAQDVIDRYRASAALWESNRERDEPPTRPERFRALAIRALRQGEVSLGRFAEYMGISRREASQFLEQEAQENEEVRIAPA